MPNPFVGDYARAYLEELAREAEQERLAHRARTVNEGAGVVDQAGDAVRHPSADEEESTMNLSELAAHVALIEEDANRRFGANEDAAMRQVYAREAVLDLWMAKPDLTAGVAHRLLRQVRAALGWRGG